MEDVNEIPELSRDRIVGALVGLATGDALGTTLEFSERDSVPLHDQMTGKGPFNLQPGQWTDDTSMALCLAASLVDTGRFDPIDQLERYTKWWKHGYMSSTGKFVDIGSQTASALDDFAYNRFPYRIKYRPYDSGNGGIMRLAPAAMAFSHNIVLAGMVSELSTRTTHPTPECKEAARIFGEAIAVGIQTGDKEAIVEHITSSESKVQEYKMKLLTKGSFIGEKRHKISSSGYVLASLNAALWALNETDNFNDGLILAVNLGHDADTVGAVYGQLAGACYGRSSIRSDWLETLYNEQMIAGFGEKIAQNIGNFTIRKTFGPVHPKVYDTL